MTLTLKQYDRTTSNGKGARGLSTLTMRLSGRVAISRRAADVLNVKAGDRLVLLQDEHEPRDWYIAFGENTGFTTRDNGGHNMVFNAAHAIKDLFASVEHPGPTGTVLLGEPETVDGRELWPLITARIVQHGYELL